VVRGDRVSLDPHTFAEDPGGSVAENPRDRERNDNRVKGESKEEELMANPKQRGWCC